MSVKFTEHYRARVRQVAVLGAGVMGAQIAAHCVNAGVPVLLYDLPADGKDKSAVAQKAIARLAKLKPAPLGMPGLGGMIQAANYDDDLTLLEDCDLIIEAIAERLDWKQDLYNMILPHITDDAIVASNTSGLGIARLADALPEQIKPRFCGVHFFNPPRYMHLLELIGHPGARPEVLDALEGFAVHVLGKGVVRAKDRPNFIGNRIGVFALLSVMKHAERLNIPLDVVDRLTGPGIGRPKSATFRTGDVVGLDTFGHVVNTLYELLPDDPWREHYRVPTWIQQLIDSGALGQKTGAGIYRKDKKQIQVLDINRGEYRPVASGLDDDMRAFLLERDPAKKLDLLQASDGAQAQFLRSVFADCFQYSAVCLQEIAETARDVDLAMRWGYGWQFGPFETWQTLGWQKVRQIVEQQIADGQTLSDQPLPGWATTSDRDGVHDAAGSYNPATGEQQAIADHPVYQRQRFRENVIAAQSKAMPTIFETDAVCLRDGGDDVAVLSFKTKMHTVSMGVLEGIQQALQTVETGHKGLVLWQDSEPFSAGADLKSALAQIKSGNQNYIREFVEYFQQTSMALKHSPVPTVAAVRGLALGGGCEFTLHCDRAVAAFETYIGLVEVGVGLIPAAGGCKELAVRAAGQSPDGDPFAFIQKYFQQVAMGKVAASALQAKDFNYLRDNDAVVMNGHELLDAAVVQVDALYQAGYRPPLQGPVTIAGDSGYGTLLAQLVNMREGGFISDHDYKIGDALAKVMCGGDLPAGSQVSEDWLLRLEIEAFVELAATEATAQRIEHTMTTGKPLRN